MATNPMQRKARMSLILGLFLGLLLGGIVIALLFMQLKGYQDKEKENNANMVDVYAINQDVKSNQVITPDMYSLIKINKNMVPSNAINAQNRAIIDNYTLQDKDGNAVQTEIKNGTAIMYIKIDNERYDLKNKEGTDNYYIEKNGEKVDLELNTVPLRAKVSMGKNTVLTKEIVGQGVNSTANDIRREEYNEFILPMDLTTGDCVDIRLLTPSGQNYIVVSKKEVELPLVNGIDSVDTIWINLSEDEILALNGAIVDSYKMEGSKLYVDKYTDPGMQKAATPTYVVPDAVYDLLQNDPNILENAKNDLRNRYKDGKRDDIQSVIDNDPTAEEKEKTKMQESITKSQDSRKQYLDSLTGAVQ